MARSPLDQSRTRTKVSREKRHKAMKSVPTKGTGKVRKPKRNKR